MAEFDSLWGRQTHVHYLALFIIDEHMILVNIRLRKVPLGRLATGVEYQRDWKRLEFDSSTFRQFENQHVVYVYQHVVYKGLRSPRVSS